MSPNRIRPFAVYICCTVALTAMLFAAFDCFAANPVNTNLPKSIRVVMDDNYPPYVFKDEQGNLKGIIIDQWELWGKKTGVHAEVTGMDWREAQLRMQAGEFDVIDTIFRNEKRESIYLFSKPYAQLDVPLFFDKDISGIRGPEDLVGFLVAAKAGDSSIDFLKKHGVTNINEYPSYEKLIEAARDGKAKVFTVDRPPALYFLNKMGIHDRFHETAPMYYGEFHRAVLRGQGNLLSLVEKGFADIQKEEYEAIDKRWLGASLTATPYLRYAFYVIAAIAIFALVLTFWLWALKRTVSLKISELVISDERHLTILQTANSGIWLVDRRGQILEVNSAYCRMSGYSEQELLTMSVADLEVNESAPKTAEHIQKIMEQGEDHFESKHRRKDGSVFDVEVSAQCQPGSDGQCVAFLQDITERKQAEEALKGSEERFRLLVENAPDAVFVRDKTCFTYLNTAAIKLFGADSAEELLGTPTIDRYHPIVRDSIRARAEIINERRKTVPLHQSICLKLDGSEVNVESSAVPITTMGTDGALVFLRNITARLEEQTLRQQLEEQLHQVQKIESIGQLAGGVAHDFNNMLGVILGHAEMALRKADPSSPFISDLQEICTAAKRSADLTRQLLTFARKQIIIPKVLDLNESVEGMFKMLQRLIGENIQIIRNPAVDLWPVKVDPSQLDQILANLCVNARDAIDGIGKITIMTTNITWDESTIASRPYYTVAGDYVQLSVSDDGCGMDKEVQAHIFEPFYTTKEVGSGTGLGLSTVYGAVKQNHGFITVYSEEGMGTVFNIYLPREKATVEVITESTAKTLRSGTETILLVEDDKMLLDMVTSMLKECGYIVLPAITTALAQTLAKEHPDPIHLLISDVIMPEMNGRELSEKLMLLRPDMKVLFLSGYTADIISSEGVVEDEIYFLQKPFSFAALTAKVREVLDGQ